MCEETRLPRNGKEGIIFLLIISIISVNIIAPVITGFELGFRKEIYLETLKIIPFMWIIVILLVNMVSEPVVKQLMIKFTEPTDGFNAKTLCNILFNVIILSFLLTVIGTWIGKREISIEPIQTFFYHWPRNFTIAFIVESLIAQPIARFAIKKIHRRQVRKSENVFKLYE